MKKLFTFIFIALSAANAAATERTVQLSVPSMDCPVCPITIKKALLKVNGVSQASVNFEKRQAIVTFEDTKTSVEALTLSTKEAGYPSTLLTTTK